ncbi:MAG: hypothetical protein RSA17_08895 [Ruthenibacterium sp.]
MAKSGCIYRYCLNGKKQHRHTISLKNFSVDTEDEILQCNQELKMICKLMEQGKTDRIQHSDCKKIPASQAQTGDLALFSDGSHVGVIVGRDAVADWWSSPCSTGRNNIARDGIYRHGL